MAINYDDPMIYENLSLAINEFEEQALRSLTREGIISAAYAPLVIMDKSLGHASNLITGVNKANTKDINISGELDADLTELFGDKNNAFRKYVEECLGCNTRITADWQINAGVLLKPINLFMDKIKSALDMFEARMDPFDALADLCWAMDHLKGFCIHDLLMLTLVLKALMKRYLTNTLQVRLDWTSVVGLLLKAIAQGVNLMLDAAVKGSLGPLDCMVSGLFASNNLFKESRSLLLATKNLHSEFDKKDNELITTAKGVHWNPKSEAKGEIIGSLATSERNVEKGTDVPYKDALTGFELRADMSLADAIKDPGWSNSTFLEKMIVPIQDATNWIRELMENIKESLEALEHLMGGSLALHLENLGILLFILDMIGIIKMIIKMLALNPNVPDWCSFLEQNPQFLEQQFRNQFNDADIRVGSDKDNGLLVLRKGPETVGVIKTCPSEKSNVDNQLIQQWIQELKQKGI
jgi:hypothetical protein